MTQAALTRLTMTSVAKTWLSDNVKELRELLLDDLENEAMSAYQLGLAVEKAALSEEKAAMRARLEDWLNEQARAGPAGAKEKPDDVRKRHFKSGIKLAAATFLNRLIVTRQLEALGLLRTKAVTGGWDSQGFRLFSEFAPGLRADESEGYALFLRLIWEELALDLPGLFGDVGVNALFPVPTHTLRHAVTTLEGKGLSAEDRESLWRDDTLLGWVYQFWNDPERDELDAKLYNNGKLENHEIASKTQLFTDRYIVEWMLQNSLGQLWFELCRRHGWTPGVVANGTIDHLESRRTEWRARRERGELDPEALMPLENDEEERWKYWVPRELPAADGAGTGPDSLKELKLLDPACGSGHFLVIAFDLLAALYEEEARHRGASWSRGQIARWIVENNLHGIDIDPRAVQIAAAAVWLKMRTYAPAVELNQMNLVASALGLGSLPPDDPALLELVRAVESETGIPARLTCQLVEALKGADYLGSLLKVDQAIERALAEHEQQAGLSRSAPSQGDLWRGFAPVQLSLSLEEARASVMGLLGEFLSHHTGAADLGLRLRGQQLAAGVRFIRLVRAGQYHLVVGNPPYQGAGKGLEAGFAYLARHYAEGKADLCTAFLLRSGDWLRQGGISLLLTIRGWMFTNQFIKLRSALRASFSVDLLGDFDQGAFSNEVGNLLAIVGMMLRRGVPSTLAIAVLPTPFDVRWRNDNRRAFRKHAALLAGEGRYAFRPEGLAVVPGHPLIYWWDSEFLQLYSRTPKVGDGAPARQGLATADNTRFLRLPWEVRPERLLACPAGSCLPDRILYHWVPYIKGAAGKVWFEPLDYAVRWFPAGLEIKTFEKNGKLASRPQNETDWFRPGVAFAMIGSDFNGRAHRFRSVFGHKGSSVFPTDPSNAVCLFNSSIARMTLESLNPGVGFEVGDVNRLPLFPIEGANQIYAQLDAAFTQHEQAREPSVEFVNPGPSPWTYAQKWAQQAVDRPTGTPLPTFDSTVADGTPLDYLSYALGVAMGRFGSAREGILSQPPSTSLPHGILFLSASGGPDSLEHPAAHSLLTAWEEHGARITPKAQLRTYLRTKFFPEDHLDRYQKRPIYLPLCSENKSFVAYVSIHRWAEDTLPVLMADHLQPELSRLAGELADLGEARVTGDRKSTARAQARYDDVQSFHRELKNFIVSVQEVAQKGAPVPPGAKCPPREKDARFVMDLDDGVMINSAGLWPLLVPQWKDPSGWWVELCAAAENKDLDWAHLAARYFPQRVDQKCQDNPSLAVTHGCFWKYHPARAYQWELRLQGPDELGPDFRLEETGSDAYRAEFERQHPDHARELRAAEEKRREKKSERSDGSEEALDFEGEARVA